MREADPYNEQGTEDRLPLPVKIPYTHEMAEHIISKIFEGNKISDLAGKHGVPDKATIFGWLSRYKDFREAYDVARESLALVAVEEIHELAEESKYFTKDEVPAGKLRFDILKFIAERNDRKRYAQSTPKDENNSGLTIVIDTGVKADSEDMRTVSDLKQEMREDEYSKGHSEDHSSDVVLSEGGLSESEGN